MSISQKIEDDFRPLVAELGYELVFVDYVKEGQDWFLRFFIDKTDGIDINDCEKVSRYVEIILDEKEYVQTQYVLEVSSLGLERPLRKDEDYFNNIGEKIEVSLYKPIDKKKKYIGILIRYDEELVLNVDDKEIAFAKANISKANILLDF
ncbi:MAG: ribosome maturation factor RimP [Firmicutes bacterium]|nr:ribosome maturation factor RimP [Bacillota bacterium]